MKCTYTKWKNDKIHEKFTKKLLPEKGGSFYFFFKISFAKAVNE
ncbi:hypothetical protein NT04LM_0786 [Listeria monocytogenes FSL F2-208]|nr:hypothetical protein NT04LM_0786 [Listeria monocytogenes FSL F2-208]